MTVPPEFDGPRLLRPEERHASQRLAEISFGHVPTDAPVPQEEPSSPPDGETHVIARGGIPVSQISLFFTPLVTCGTKVVVGSIGGVCTHPEARGYGLATRLLEHCTRRLVQGGARWMLISGGRGLYTRVGCVPVERYRTFFLRPGQLHPIASGVSLRPACAADAGAASRLYNGEPVHFVRPFSKFGDNFGSQGLFFEAEKWIDELESRPAAYLLLNIPWSHVHQPEAGVRCVFEYAGSRVALAHALGLALSQAGIRELEVPVMAWDQDFALLLQQAGGRWRWGMLPDHTLRVINFPGLMRDLRQYVRSLLDPTIRRGLRFEQTGPLLGGEGGDSHAIIRGKERLALDGAGMTRLLMGGAERLEEPLSGALAEIVSTLFPLPAFSPGMDYH